jgi:hypothetical protein
MVADLEARTGRKVERVEVGKIDFLKDTADLRVYFAKEDQNGWSVPELEEDTEAS